CAGWLVAHGARHLALVGRRTDREAALAEVAALRARGVEVTLFQADVVEEGAIQSVLDAIGKHMPPLLGVIHAAGPLDDGMFLHQSWSRYEKVLAPKVQGAWNLHHLTVALPLDFFVLFSSAVTVVGHPGQGSYAAANAFLDALARYRQAR